MSMDEVNHLAVVLAAAKYVKDTATDVEKRAKASLVELMAPGDRKVAVQDDAPVGSVSRTVITNTETIVVTNEPALVRWLKEHRDGDGVETVERVQEWKKADLLREVTETGDLPDGVEIEESTRGGYLQVRQSEDQVANLVTASGGVMGLLDGYRKEIGQ